MDLFRNRRRGPFHEDYLRRWSLLLTGRGWG